MTGLSAEGADPVLRLFDAKAATWSSKYAPDGRLTGRLTQLVGVVEHRVSPGGHVLDLGCATGELARSLAARGYRLTGCDISAEMLDRAEALDTSRSVAWVRLMPGWQALPFESSSLDAVVASSVLEYIDDPRAVLAECARVIRPGGTVLCTVPDMRHPVRWLEQVAALIAHLPPVRAAAARSPRLTAYLSYLSISRQRRSRRGWRAAAAECGLRMVPDSPITKPAPLCLLTSQRPLSAKDM